MNFVNIIQLSMQFQKLDRVIKEMNQKRFPINIYLDLSKAFDTLDHEILLCKLEYYGIRGISLKLLENYFFYRKQYVLFNDACSSLRFLTALFAVLEAFGNNNYDLERYIK